ncbi:reverse transcriptase [Plakobranchus ocellatus]|uniref:Reverse transcriptase n=1 Tax=Plakobranchus ocellatus TaxID=259542 RepID=A0AAV4D565_9GAST|nr:reverse transcriptase [Plakobranchus ocellatus]
MTAEGVYIPNEQDSRGINQFRPISLLNVEGKIFFSVMASRLTKYLTENGYINTSVQKGGIPGVSGCLEHATMIWEAIQRTKSEKLNLDVVWLDLKNAYGSVPREMIQLALRMYHVPEVIQVMLDDYFNVSQFTTSNGSWLTDNDDGTCNNDGNAEPITVTLVTPHPLTWVRVVVSDSTYVNDLQLSYRTSVSTPAEQCTEARSAKVNDNILDIFCPTSVIVNHVTLSGPAVRGLCTLYISGGRNVALKQATEQSSCYQGWYARHAVDGSPSGPGINFNRFSTCSHTSDAKTASKPGWWRVTFSNFVEIHRFIIYNRRGKHDSLQ